MRSFAIPVRWTGLMVLARSEGLTWAGQSYDGYDGKPTGDLVLEDVVDGIIQLNASSEALLYIHGTTS